MSATAKFSVGPIVRADWLARDIAATIDYENSTGEHEQQSNPFAAFVESSAAALTRVELEAIARDAIYYSDRDGPGGSDESLRRAYGRLVKSARAAAATLPPHEPCSTCGAAITLSDTGRRVHADYSLAVRGRWGMICSPADERCTFGVADDSDVEPCSDCGQPVRYSDADGYRHVDPSASPSCFLNWDQQGRPAVVAR